MAQARAQQARKIDAVHGVSLTISHALVIPASVFHRLRTLANSEMEAH
jgi:hypothetical protein